MVIDVPPDFTGFEIYIIHGKQDISTNYLHKESLMFGRTMRLRRYARTWRRYDLKATESSAVAETLATVWHGFRVKDLVVQSPSQRSGAYLTTWIPTIVELNQQLLEHNQLIAQGAEHQIERRVWYDKAERAERVLDFYFADPNHLPIDDIAHLRRLQGLLQAHVYLVSQHDNQYYRRLSERYYEDIIALTYTLLDVNLPQKES